jgi:septation ring formation regulator EzrA
MDNKDEVTTKPTIETVLERLTSFAQEIRSEMRAGFAALGTRLDRVESRLDKVENKIEVMTQDLMDLRGDIHQFEKKLNKIEDHLEKTERNPV